jgi:hypothetical protein
MLRMRLDDHAADGKADLDKASTAAHEATSQYLPLTPQDHPNAGNNTSRPRNEQPSRPKVPGGETDGCSI